MPYAKHDVPDSVSLQEAQLMRCKWLPVQLEQRLRYGLRHRPQTSCEAARKNRNCQQ